MTDIPGNSSTFASLAVGSAATDSIETIADHDWYRISLTAGQAVTVAVNLLTLEDSYLNIRDSSGNIIYSNDDIVDGVERGSRISFDPSYTGTYYIDVGAWDDKFTGTYQVSVQPYTQPPIATNDQIAAQIVSGFWGGDSHHFNVTQGGTITVNISTLKASEQALAHAALQEWTDIIGVHFQEVTTGGQILFDNSEDSSGPVAATDSSYSNGITTSAHVHISSSWVNTYGTGLNTYSFLTYIHEIGHALGLGHAGDYNNTATFPYDASFLNDAWSTSVMSYFDERENSYFSGLGFTRAIAVTPMPADILAMQQLYGLSTTTRTGDTAYGYNSNAGGIYSTTAGQIVAFTIFDNGGNDTFDFSGNSQTQLINLNPETYSNVYGLVGNMTIARGTVIENAIGGGGADTIIGNSADNILTGNLGPDTLTGGAGSDAFRDSEAGHSGDTITDFGAGDNIVFTDASLGSFSFSLSGHMLTYTGGSLTLTNVAVGRIAASAAAGGGVQLTVAPVAHNDFTGEGRSDVLLRANDGTLTAFTANANGSFTASGASYGVPSNWHVIGTGDFNGDNHVDLLWQNTTDGTITDWLGQANGAFSSNAVYYNTGPSWSVIGTGDFNGDGRADLLWQNTSGTITNWLGQADGSFTSNPVYYNVGSDWHVIQTADFNGDGYTDLLWQKTDGTITDWLGQGDGSFTSNPVYYNAGSWQVIATGDFNGDTRADLLWQNTDGTITDWLGQVDGSFTSNPVYYNAGSSWHMVGTGDYNGDTRADLLWQNTNGTITDWLGQANGSFSSNPTYADPGTNWHIQDPSAHNAFL